MYATGSMMCPVSSFEKYLSKRNSKSSALFQHPKSSFCDDDNEWYENKPIEKNMLGSLIVSNNTLFRSPCGESGDIYMVFGDKAS
jgi:hypothetical protein